MPRRPGSRRGRTPSIATAAVKVRRIKRHIRALTTEMQRLEDRLMELDSYFRFQTAALRAKALARTGPGEGLRGRGPNVRDVAHAILARSRRPMGISDLARLVVREKGGKAGENFVQNLGAALHRDRRFRRISRGIYSAREVA